MFRSGHCNDNTEETTQPHYSKHVNIFSAVSKVTQPFTPTTDFILK